MNEKYYVYVYMDPRIPGKFIFSDLEFEFQPIYVGKGTKDRVKRHLFLYKERKTHFHNKLALIIKEGYQPSYKIVKENLSEEESFKEERRIISIIGRQDNGGMLTNLTDGGDGQSGLKHKEESKTKISNSLKNNIEFQEYMKSEEFSKKISEGLIGHKGYGKGVPRTEEVKNKIKESLKNRPGRKHTDSSKEKMSLNNSGKNNPNSKVYIIKKDNELLEFETRKDLYDYIESYNKENKLLGPNRVSVEGIIYKGKSKNFFLVEVKKLKQSDNFDL